MVKQYAKARGNSPPEHLEESERVFDYCIADYIRVAGELGARVEFSLLAEDAKYPLWIRERFRNLADSNQDLPQLDTDVLERIYRREYDVWRSGRRAVIHTLDNSSRHSKHAESTIRNFRQGMYAHNVDFHTGSISEYITSRLEETEQEVFLDHAILDLPNTHSYMDLIGRALKPNGSLVTWNPSISQVSRCVDEVGENKSPFLLEKVLEVVGGMNGGREWDVRRAKVRALEKVPTASDGPQEIITEPGVALEDVEQSSSTDASVQSVMADRTRYEMVCRPKVGERIQGGGFISLWRRMEQY
jgi:tRNA (adenine57-N1/adenine58-N1)-methyltransferase